MTKNVTTTNTVAGKIYAEVAAKHPDWKQPRVYAVTKSILEKRSAKAKAAVKAEE